MNPRQDVSAITLRSGKELEEPIRKRDRGHDLNAETEPETEVVMKKPAECVQNEEKSSPLDGNPIIGSMAEQKTLREHATPQVNQPSLCIATPTLQAPLELKSGLIHLLPKFRGLMNEDPYQHLKEFYVVCSSMKPERVAEEQIKLRAFPFSLDVAAKEWLFYLPTGSVTSWEEMMRLFLDRYFPSSMVINNFQSRPQVPSSSQQPSSSRSDSSLEHIMKSLALNTQQFQMSTQQFQNETRSSIQSLESQVSKLATSMSKLESQGKLPSQTDEMNLRQNVSAITIRSGKELEEPIRKRDRGHGLNAETEPETEVVMKKPAECVQNEENQVHLMAIQLAEEKTLREHAAPQVNQPSLCIATPTLQAPLELKSGLIHLLPKFRGLMNEDPYQHLKEFYVVCSSMKPERVTEDQIKLRTFPFSLDGAAKEWLFYLPAGSVTSWEEMMRLFLDRYFPSSRVINVRRDICGIKQKVTESLFDYWERFKKLCASCPQHDIPEQSLLHYFYEGLLPTERSKLPSQTEMNPRQNVSAITLRSGKELEEPIRKRDRGHDLNAETEPETEVVMKKPAECVQNEEKSSPLDGMVIKPPFPKRLVQLKKKSEEKDMMEELGFEIFRLHACGF
ncbi:uncharacterized protein G2W53_003949 [Senna tora]|uniref:Retrotransposon gag domain-containing protein n=1 Tax=Senna tora TaxID=362788 RepID=A0A835CHJ7_9FABA|nr:uncharacterized protein G2W53_003949 [Senna tora]